MKIEDRIIIKTIIIGISITKKIEDQIIIIEMEVFKIIGMEISKIIITNLIIKNGYGNNNNANRFNSKRPLDEKGIEKNIKNIMAENVVEKESVREYNNKSIDRQKNNSKFDENRNTKKQKN